MAIERQPATEATFPNAAEICMVWEGYGPKESATQKVPDNAPLPKNFYRQYAPWGVRAQDLAEPKNGLVRHRNGGNVLYFDTHAKFVAYGTGNTNNERVASIEKVFPAGTTVAPQTPTLKWVW
jgi:prepilin-type processing-associated H-X9-DG protein